jgi:hypothetical protein
LARSARQHQPDTERIQTINASRTNFAKAQTKVQALPKELGCLMQEASNHSLMQSPSDRIYLDVSSTLIIKSQCNECGV